MNYLKIGFVLIGAMICSTFATAQETDKVPGRWALQLSLQHRDLAGEENIGQLQTFHEVAIRPVYSLEGQYFFRHKKPHKRSFVSGQLSWYNNLYLERWLSVQAGLGIEFSFLKVMYGSIRLDAGLSHVKGTAPEYVLEDGIWVTTQNTTPGFVAFQLSPRVDLGARILEGAHPLDVFLTASGTLLGHPEYGLLPFYSVGGGVRYHF